MDTSTPRQRQFVLDTNVLISDPMAPLKFDEHTVVIPMTVLEELDHLKDSPQVRHASISKDARLAIQNLKKIIGNASSEAIHDGVPIGGKSAGHLRVINDYSLDDSADKALLGSHLPNTPDNRIITTSLYLAKTEKDVDTVLVTKDINMQLKARAAGLDRVEDYLNEQQLDDISYLACGYATVPFDFLATLSTVQSRNDKQKTFYTVQIADLTTELSDSMHLNQFWIEDGEQGEGCDETDADGKVFCVRAIDELTVEIELFRKSHLMKANAFGIKPRNLKQALALYALLDEKIDLVQLTGPAGSGKTLLALAAALEQSSKSGERKIYDKIIVTRSTPDMAEDIGFLPGSEEEKMAPWLAAFTDSLEVLAAGSGSTKGHTSDKPQGADAIQISIAMMRQHANLQFKAITFMRGRSLQSTFLILDETQNLTPHQMRTMITRIGQGSKLVILGNLNQIDNSKYVSALSSGLTHAVDKMKNYAGSVVVSLPGGQRSALSSFAEENL